MSTTGSEKKRGSVPPILEAAIPVDAVIEMTSGVLACFLWRAEIIARSRSDFPVPKTRSQMIGGTMYLAECTKRVEAIRRIAHQRHL